VFATTRGKTSTTPGYLCAFALDPDSSHLTSPSSPPAAVYQTPTSGGKANAIEVIQVNGRGTEGEKEWIVLTDDEEGWVVVISWDGIKLEEVTRVKLLPSDGASHAVWLE
jgi:carboxy-cis,cis-muconate cyclase